MTRAAFAPVKPCAVELPKFAVRRLFDQLGGIKRAAIRLGLKKSQTYDLADPDRPDEITWAQVAALTGADSAAAAAEYLALLAGGVFLPIAVSAEALGELTADSIREHGEACAELVRALTDHSIDATERARTLGELDQALRVLVQLRCAVAAKREGSTTTD